MLLKRSPYIINILLLVVGLLFSVLFGAIPIHPKITISVLTNLLPGINLDSQATQSITAIIQEIRLPHTILMALTGASLAASGATFQGLFRNPLADPYLIGAASGAGLGAVGAMVLQIKLQMDTVYIIPFGAFIGTISTVLIVYSLAKVGRIVPLTTLILAGVAIGTFASAVTSFLMLKSEPQIYRALSFLLGGGTLSGWKPVLGVLPYSIVGLILLTLSGHLLNVLQFGETQAQQMGINVELSKGFIIAAASLTTAGAVAFSGVIGFVGLIVPHIVRILWGVDYRKNIPLSILLGATTLLLADLVARVLLAPQTLPVGIITALAGTPFFIIILRQAKSKVFW